MIYLIADKSSLIPGEVSIYLQADTSNEQILEVINSLELHEFNQDRQAYEFAVTDLAYLLDTFTYLDEIKLVIPENIEYTPNIVDTTLQAKYKVTPFKYQEEAVKYGLANNSWLLLDEMGLGKSITAMCLAEELHARGLIDHCLIVCGIASLRQNWKHELQKNSTLSCRISGEHITKTGTIQYKSLEDRKQEFLNPIDDFFVIANIESFRLEPKKNKKSSLADAINKGPNKFDLIIFDEAHKAKGYNTKQAAGMLKLNSKYKVAMTGTLITNTPVDCYFPLAWLGIENAKNATRFKQLFCVFDPEIRGRIIGYKNTELLKYEVEHHSLRRTKEDLKKYGVDIKDKFVYNKYIELDPKQQEFYTAIENAVEQEYKETAVAYCDKIKLKAANELSLLTRLRQAAVCPSILSSENIVSSKMEYAIDMVEELVSHNNKVVILSKFKQPLEILNERLKIYNPIIVTGDTKEADVVKGRDMFQDDNEHMVWLGTHDKCGTGLTLNRAQYMIMLDSPWTAAGFDQCADRIHRVNNTTPAFIYNLIAENTIDIVVSKLVERKAAISDYLIDDEVDADSMKILSRYLQDLGNHL